MNLQVQPWTTVVDVETLAAALAGAGHIVLLDARAALGDPDAGARMYAQGHLPGARHVDLERDLSDHGADHDRSGEGRHPLPRSDAFAAKAGAWGIAPGVQVVVYDAAEGSMAAARAWWLLRLLGHREVAVLDGGLRAWTEAGHAVETASTFPVPLPPYPGRFDRSQWVDASEVQARLGDAPGWLLDARAVERFRGEVEPIDPVAGHVPGAVSSPFAANVMDGRLRPPAEMRARLEPLLAGNAPADVVLMCGSGVTACHLLLALEVAGLGGARVYPGSWSGWISDAQRPLARG